MGSLDLFISDPLIVDLGLFGAWLEGLRVEEAVGYEGVSPDEALQELTKSLDAHRIEAPSSSRPVGSRS